MFQNEIEQSTKGLLQILKDEKSKFIGFYYENKTLQVVPLNSNEKIKEFQNVTKFSFGFDDLPILTTVGSEETYNEEDRKVITCTISIYLYKDSNWEDLKVSIEYPKELKELNDKGNEIKLGNSFLLSSHSKKLSIYNPNLHSLYVWNLERKEKEITLKDPIIFNTFSKIYSILMTNTLVVLGSSSIQIYNHKHLLKEKSEEIQTGRSINFKKQNEKTIQIKSITSSKFIILLSSGDLYYLNCQMPFDDDNYVKVSKKVKDFDILSSSTDEDPVLLQLTQNNQLIISKFKNDLLNVSTVIIMNEEIDKICYTKDITILCSTKMSLLKI